jgi:hypothetical protein
MTGRWRSGLVLLLSAALFFVVVLLGPGSELGAMRHLLGFGDDPLGTPADVRPGGVYAFLEHQPGRDDLPVTWDPCREIHYEINPAEAPESADQTVAFVRDGVAEVASITGLKFTYDGETDRRPDPSDGARLAGRAEPVLIAWASDDEVSELKGDVAGVGGAAARSFGDDGRLWYVTGGVTLDADSFAQLEDEPDGTAYQRAILLHELGHLVGLDHVKSSHELMFADNVGRRDFGQGDLNGLVRMGKGDCR